MVAFDMDSDRQASGVGLRIGPDCVFRITSRGALAVKVGAKGYLLPEDSSGLVGCFFTTATRDAVYERQAPALSRVRFDELVDELLTMGVLVAKGEQTPSEGQDVVGSGDGFESVLSPAVLEHGEAIAGLLQAGRAVVIRHAFRSSFASRLRIELDGIDDWSCAEILGDRPHFRHHTVSAQRSDYPALRDCLRRFESPAGRELAARLSGCPCDGPVELGATNYLTGDFAMPHADDGLNRTLAFVWHLSTDWNSAWGGCFGWMQNGVEIVPSFNTLLLFRVSPASVHMVTPVSRFAKGKRLSVTGWWTRAEAASTADETGATVGQRWGLMKQRYGPPPRAIDEHSGIFAL